MTGQYAQDAVMTTPLTLSAGDTVSFDSKLTQNAWWSDAGFSFIDNTGLYDSNHNAQRGGKILRFNQSAWEFYAYDPSNAQQAYWFLANSSSDNINYKWTFDSATHVNVTMTVGSNAPVSAGWNITNISDIKAFRAGLWDSQQTQTVSNFKQRPALLPASGNTYIWTAAGGDYTSSTNWLGGVAPTTGDDALIANGGIATVNTANASSGRARTLQIGNATGSGTLEVQSGGELFAGNSIRLGISTGSGTVNQSGGLVAIDLGGDQNLRVGFDAAGTGNYNLSGGELWVGDSLTMGKDGTGTFTMTGGWISHAGFMTVGRSAGSNGTFNMSAGTVDQTFGDFEVGNLSTGTANLSGGTFNVAPGRAFAVGNRLGGTGIATIGGTALVKTSAGGDLFIAGNDNTVTQLGGTGTLNINGGEVQVDDDFVVGNYGAGTLNMTAGLVSKSGWIVVGNNPGSNGTFTLSGGTINQTFGDIEIGDESTGNATFSGGTFNGSWGFFVGNRRSGNGTATINGSALVKVQTVTVGGQNAEGSGAYGTGTLHIDGGELQINDDFVIGHLGTGTVTMTAGLVSKSGWIVLGDEVGSSGTFNMSGGTVNQTFGDLEIGDAATGTLNLSGGTLNIAGTVFTSKQATGNGHANVTGGTLNASAMINNGVFDFTGGNANVGVIDGSGTTNVGSTQLLQVAHVRQNSLTVNGGTVKINPSGAANGVSVVNTLSINSGGKLDLTNNELIVKSIGVGTASGGVYNGVSGMIQSGRNNGGWGGSGIITSQTTAIAGNLTTLGVASAAQAKGIGATDTAVWNGQTVTGGDTLVMYTYGGDANLDGKINVDDYGRIDFAVPLGIAGWSNGDFNYDGKINVDDYGIIDFNVGIQGPPFGSSMAATSGIASVSAVPEPASIGLITMVAAGLIARRRRRL